MRIAPALLVVLLSTVSSPLFAQDAKITRGQYLVEEVGRCQECHTPKTASNEFDRTRWLKGAKLTMTPITPIQGWNGQAPDITSTSRLWMRWMDEGMVTFLETAKNPRGGHADPPMPAYALSKDDAEAIVAFLKSLP